MNLKELSEKLRLSQTTISRALNGYPEVSETTRKRVIAAAMRYDYRPNGNAARLATGRSMAIGHVIPVSSEHEVVNPIFSEFVAGAGEVYALNGYSMQLSVVPDDRQVIAYRAMAYSRVVDGLIVHVPQAHDFRIDMLNEIGLPFVVHGRDPGEPAPYSWLDVDNTGAFRRATEYLLSAGHRRIALINGRETTGFAIRRQKGYEMALRDHGITPDRSLMRFGEMMETYGHEAVSELMQTINPPTAFLVSSIIPAIGARRALADLGLEPGRDISIVIHDDDLSYLRNTGDPPMFTATRSSIRSAGRRSAELLLDIIRQPQRGPVQELWDVEFVVGQSTGPAPAETRSQ